MADEARQTTLNFGLLDRARALARSRRPLAARQARLSARLAELAPAEAEALARPLAALAQTHSLFPLREPVQEEAVWREIFALESPLATLLALQEGFLPRRRRGHRNPWLLAAGRASDAELSWMATDRQLSRWRGACGENALMAAAQACNPERARRFLGLFDPRERDALGRTALHHALAERAPDGAAHAQLEVVRLLAPLSDLRARAGFERTPLMLAALHAGAPVLEEIASRLPASALRRPDKLGLIPLAQAASELNVEAFAFLLSRSPLDMVDVAGRSLDRWLECLGRPWPIGVAPGSAAAAALAPDAQARAQLLRELVASERDRRAIAQAVGLSKLAWRVEAQASLAADLEPAEPDCSRKTPCRL
jgi:hypothetical protein